MTDGFSFGWKDGDPCLPPTAQTWLEAFDLRIAQITAKIEDLAVIHEMAVTADDIAWARDSIELQRAALKMNLRARESSRLRVERYGPDAPVGGFGA
jgi:hypothetical protein